MSRETITIVSHPDNRVGPPYDAKGRAPVVQVLISRFGDVHSICFHPSRAQEIADAIAKAGRAAKRGRKSEQRFVVKDDQ